MQVEGLASAKSACTILANCAGLGSVALARNIAGLEHQRVPRAYFCKGSYFGLPYRAPFRHLIYPLPEADGLGVHLTLDLAGAARFGPDTQWIESVDYNVEATHADRFGLAIRRYWPGLRDRTLRPAYAGVRSRIAGPDEPLADFRIDGAREHCVPGFINLFGIDSPGLTAALALAEYVACLAQESLKSERQLLATTPFGVSLSIACGRTCDNFCESSGTDRPNCAASCCNFSSPNPC